MQRVAREYSRVGEDLHGRSSRGGFAGPAAPPGCQYRGAPHATRLAERGALDRRRLNALEQALRQPCGEFRIKCVDTRETAADNDDVGIDLEHEVGEATGDAVQPDVKRAAACGVARARPVNEVLRDFDSARNMFVKARKPRPGDVAFDTADGSAATVEEREVVPLQYRCRDRRMAPLARHPVPAHPDLPVDAIAAERAGPEDHPNHAPVAFAGAAVRLRQRERSAVVDRRHATPEDARKIGFDATPGQARYVDGVRPPAPVNDPRHADADGCGPVELRVRLHHLLSDRLDEPVVTRCRRERPTAEHRVQRFVEDAELGLRPADVAAVHQLPAPVPGRRRKSKEWISTPLTTRLTSPVGQGLSACTPTARALKNASIWQ